jgi:hypothetical protein
MAVAPYEVAGERRRRLEDCDPRWQRRKVQGFGVHLHLREKSLAEALTEADHMLAVDTAPRPTLPSEHLVDLPTGQLEGTHHHSLHHLHHKHSHQFAMLLHLARIGHILQSHLYPREWALDGRSSGEKRRINHTTCYTPKSASPPPPSGTSACCLAFPFFGRGIWMGRTVG